MRDRAVRPFVTGSVAAAVLLSSAGCTLSHFAWTSYDSVDAWRVGSRHWDDPSSLGVIDGGESFPGYAVDVVLIQTPVYLLHDATKLVVLPFTLPYYGARRAFGRADDEQAPEPGR